MLLEPMIDKREEIMEIQEYVEKALTQGIKIRNHGSDPEFQREVDEGFKRI